MDQRKTVLLADAGEEFRTLLWEEMEKTGEFSVEIARDGNEILKRVKERMPDLLVMDVMLPAWTASACCGNCRSRETHL